MEKGKLLIHCEGFNDDMAISSNAIVDMSEMSAKLLSAVSVGCVAEYVLLLENELDALKCPQE